jgi:co-chaperonin GroES (HSP10)
MEFLIPLLIIGTAIALGSKKKETPADDGIVIPDQAEQAPDNGATFAVDGNGVATPTGVKPPDVAEEAKPGGGTFVEPSTATIILSGKRMTRRK